MSVEPVLAVGVLAVGLAVVVLVTAVVFGSTEPTGVAKSLAAIEQMRVDRGVARHELAFRERLLLPTAALLQRLARRLSPRQTPVRLQKLLDFAGNPTGWTVERLLALKSVGLLVGLVVGGLLGGIRPLGLLLAAALGAFCFWLPDLLTHNRGKHRQSEIQRSLPDALDMLTVCVEAGLAFDSALLQVAQKTSGPVAGEFSRVLQEIQIGKSRVVAFTDLAARTDVNELRTFVSALTQADRLGIPIAGVLREQAKEMRLIRRQRAEERAQKVPVKILFPLIFCIFPALFVVVMGPAAMRIMSIFTNQ